MPNDQNSDINALRSAYWDSISTKHAELDALHDIITSSQAVYCPTRLQIRAVVMMLPADIIGDATQWSFSDTVVRDKTFDFLVAHKDEIRDRLKPTGQE